MTRRIRRRDFLHSTAVAGVAAVAASSARGKAPTPPAFELDEATLDDLQKALDEGRHTSRSLVEAYLERIDQLNTRGPELRAVIETNPGALETAEALDAERKTKGARGALHGIPILLKDNIDTSDRMTTTAGSFGLEGSVPPRDSFVAERLRAAGAVLLGKADMSEWANFRSTRSSSGWSGRGGQCRNPYALDRSPSGSSSGSAVAVAANLCPVAVGTETDGSVISPSSCNSIVGIKPTLGLVSRSGIVPISHSQDTAGPMARTVRDAAILLGAMAGADVEDAATAASRGRIAADYTRLLDENGLKGARIGVCRKLFTSNPRVHDLMEVALGEMRRLGATVVDPADLPSTGKFGDAEFEVLLFEFKADLNAYLARLGADAPARTLAELIAFNEKNAEREMPFFGQELFVMSEAKGPLTDPKYKKALADSKRLSRAEGIDAAMKLHRLDALVAPSSGPPWLIDHVNGDYGTGDSTSPAAVAGYPSITVPLGYVFDLPVGISFFGRAWTEPALLRYAYAFERATTARRPPQFRPSSVG